MLVLCNRYLTDIDIKTYYSKRIECVFIPYVVWSTIYMMLDKKYLSLNEFVMCIFTGDSYFHMCYMGMFIRISLYFLFFLILARFIVYASFYYDIFKKKVFNVGLSQFCKCKAFTKQ